MQLKKSLLTLALGGVLASLAACDGGQGSPDVIPIGGGSPTPPPPPTGDDPFPVSNVFTQGTNNRILSPGLNSDGRPGPTSPDLQASIYSFSGSSPDLQDATYQLPGTLGAFFDSTNYVGALPQDTNDNWTEGWTISINGNTTVWRPATSGTLAGAVPVANGSCPAGTTDIGDTSLPAGISGAMDVCQLPRRFDTNAQTVTLTNDNIYRLAAGFPGTYVGNGEAPDGDSTNDVEVTLAIEPGTLILGAPQEALIITRNSNIQAMGTAEDPIVMSSFEWFDDWLQGSNGESGRGEWAGFAILGYAPENRCGTPCDVAAEGNIGAYGGTNDADNSGEVRYLVVRHAGNDIDGNGNELNGISLFGVGSGTQLSFLQSHKGLDDGIEWFGGSVSVKYLVVTDAADDSVDWGQGWTGNLQFVVARQAADVAGNVIEADNDATDPNAVPRSRPTIANATFIGAPAGDPASAGLLLRRGTGALLYNLIVIDFPDYCIDVDEAATAALFGTDLVIESSLIDCAVLYEQESTPNVTAAAIDTWYTGGANNRVGAPNLQSNGKPNPVSGAGSDFVTTDYVGAFTQDTPDTWTDGWTIAINGNNTVWQPASNGTLAGATPVADGTCPAGTTLEAGAQDLPPAFTGQMDLCRLERRYATDGATLTLTNDNIYLLAVGFPGTYIGNGEAPDGDSANDVDVTLVVEPGTLILGSAQEALIVTRGSRIEADGTVADPIMFSSRQQFNNWVAGGDGDAGRGEWAGLALLGYARENRCGTPCDVEAEGNIGAYGGTNDADSSGTLRFVVVAHAGNDIDGNGNELNGISLFGVGSGTEISFVQSHRGLDDGVEWFGGTVFADHVVVTDAADDSIDWGQGWTGGVQFAVVRQGADQAGFGIEADNDAANPDAQPISGPTIANATFIGSSGGATDDTIGWLLRRGTGALISNSIVTGFDNCLDLDDARTFDRFIAGDIRVNNSVLTCTNNFLEE